MTDHSAPTRGEITNDMILACSEEAFALGDEIVLSNHGAGNAAVLIDRALKAHRLSVIEEAAKACEVYAEVNMEICGDNIILDPVLRGEGFSDENMARSESHQNLSLIHSSKYHAANELASLIRNLGRGV